MQNLGRRSAIFSGFSAAMLVLAGCEGEPKPSSTATLLNNAEVHAAVKDLIAAADDLENSVEGFDTENWRNVVPNVKTAAAQVTGAVVALRQALGYPDAT